MFIFLVSWVQRVTSKNERDKAGFGSKEHEGFEEQLRGCFFPAHQPTPVVHVHVYSNNARIGQVPTILQQYYVIQEVKQGKEVAAAAQGLSLISMEVRKLSGGLVHVEADLNPGATVIRA